MSAEESKSIVRRVIQEVFVRRSDAAVDQLVSPAFTPHSWPNVQPGIASLKEAMKRVSAGLADTTMTVEDMIAEGDKVAVRLTARGRHAGEFMGMPPSDRSYEISETHIFRVENGKVIEHWRDADMLGMMQQIGALPVPGAKSEPVKSAH